MLVVRKVLQQGLIFITQLFVFQLEDLGLTRGFVELLLQRLLLPLVTL
jgi:hypothetical protein